MSEPTVSQHQKVAYRVVDGAAVLVSPADSSLYMLNPVASRIWELADGSRTVSAIIGELVAEYDVDADTARADVTEMIEEFRAKDLIVVGGQTS